MSTSVQVDLADEDVDDLDDIVDQFDPAPPKLAVSASHVAMAPIDFTPAAAPTITATSTPLTQPGPSGLHNPLPKGSGSSTDDSSDVKHDPFPSKFAASFEQELAKGMESLMREIGGGAPFSGEHQYAGEETEEQEHARQQLRAAWEAMLIQELGGEEFGSSAHGGSVVGGERLGDVGVVGPAKESGTFQHTIQQTMEKLKKSESNLQTDASSTMPSNDDMASIEALIAQLSAGNPDGLPNSQTEEELHSFLETMMGQLMSKEVLYEPLKELCAKFPGYLRDNASTLSDSDKKRYESQSDYVSQIITVFEDPKYSEEDVDSCVKIVGLMSEIQALGSPPVEIMGPMPPGFTLGPDGMPQNPEGCTIA